MNADARGQDRTAVEECEPGHRHRLWPRSRGALRHRRPGGAERRGRSAGHPYRRGPAGRRGLAQRAQGCRERTARLRPDGTQRVLRAGRSRRGQAPHPACQPENAHHGQSRAAVQAGEARAADRFQDGCHPALGRLGQARRPRRRHGADRFRRGAEADGPDRHRDVDLLPDRARSVAIASGDIAAVAAVAHHADRARPARRDRACRCFGGGDAPRRQRIDRPHEGARGRIRSFAKRRS